MYSQIFVLTRRYHSPSSPGRLVRYSSVCLYVRACVCVCMCSLYAYTGIRMRVCETGATDAPFFHPPPRGGIHFSAQRPRLPRTARPPFDCFDYPYLIPRSSSLQPFPDHYRRWELASFPRSRFTVLVPRHRKASLYDATTSVLPRGLTVAEIHCRRYTQKSQMDLTYVGEVAGAFLKFTKRKNKRLAGIKGSQPKNNMKVLRDVPFQT